MNWDNLQDIISWCKDHVKQPKGYDIYDIKVRNLGAGFKVVIAFQLASDIIAPFIIQMYVVDTYGNIKEFKEAIVNDWKK